MPDLRFEFYEYPKANVLDVISSWGTIDFDPVYQRKSDIWELPRKQLFIDSIINGMDLPKMYFHELPPGAKPGTKYAVIDGKQRLFAIRDYVTGHIPLAPDFEDMQGNYKGASLYYKELGRAPGLKARFDRCTLPIVVMRTTDEVIIEGLFVRLNEAKALNAPEKRNAFGGPITGLIRELATHRFFTTRLPFEDDRYRHRDMAAKFLRVAVTRRFISTKKAELDEFVKGYRDGRLVEPKPEELLARAVAVCNRMAAFFRARDPLLRNVGWVSLYFHIFRSNDVAGVGLTRQHFEQFISRVESNRRLARTIADGNPSPRGARVDQNLVQFDNLRQSPNDAAALRTRYEILKRYFEHEFDVTLPERR